MTYEVLARKWRPQQFDDVVGQAHVSDTLKNAIESERVAHAYLLVGPRGVGKTSTARILAKALNCERGPTTTPCGVCNACSEIMGGNSLDVLEIDGASNTGVDQVRDLRDHVMYAPVRGPYKIYIIDEVHMLSIAAFNALLKTLEEPPEHVKFLFATTEPQKVPPTILSRCQRFDLRRISAKDIVQRLAEIAEAEGVTIENDALVAIARGAEGGLRDAESALDQLIAFKGETIREEDVLSVFALVARRTLEELGGCILDGDVVRAIQIVAELDEAGKDLQRLNLELLEHFKNILIAIHGDDALRTLGLAPEQVDALKRQSSGAHADRALRVVDMLTECENRMRYGLSKRTLFETTLIRASRVATVVTIDEVLGQLNALKDRLDAGDDASREVASPMEGVKRVESPTHRTREEDVVAAPEIEASSEASSEAGTREEAAVPEVERLTASWDDILDHVGRIAVLAKRCLADAKPVCIRGDVVVLGFDPEFTSSKEKAEASRNRNAIQKVIGRSLGREIRVEFEILDDGSALPRDRSPAQRDTGDARAGDVDTEDAGKPSKTREEWLHNPIVHKTLEMFNGDIVDVRE